MPPSHFTLQRAASLTGESNFLDLLVDDFSNEESKQVYADWLEEQGDTTRAGFLRQYAAAFKSMKPDDFPELESVSPSWAAIIGCTLAKAIADHEASQFRDELFKLARPSLVYEVIDEDEYPELESGFDEFAPIGSTKFFGLPDLSSSHAWPTQADCNTFYMEDSGIEPRTLCSFVAQINFADFQGTQAGRLMPQQGLLSIFSCAEWDSIGMTDTYLHFAPSTDGLVRATAPPTLLNGEDEANQLVDSVAIRVQESLDFPSIGSESPFPLLKRDYDDDLYDLFSNIREQASGEEIETILGFTRPTSGDDPLPGADWLSLICIQSAVEQQLHFAIREEDLNGANFDKTRLVWVDFD